MDETIYHYCSLQTFNSIVSGKNLRLSNAFKTNDSFELKWIFQLIKEEKLLSQTFLSKLEAIYDYSLSNYFRPHMVCFSGSGDLLSQWRAYGNWGAGVSIGFNKIYFKKSELAFSNKEFKIFKVIYSIKSQLIEIKKVLNNLESEKEIDNLLESDLKFAKNSLLLFLVANKFYELGIKFKNPTFSEEKEIRIVHGYPGVAAEPDMFKYNFTENNLVSFVELPIDLKDFFPSINEITLGPRSHASLYDIKHYMENTFSFQSGLKYYKSKCSLV